MRAGKRPAIVTVARPGGRSCRAGVSRSGRRDGASKGHQRPDNPRSVQVRRYSGDYDRGSRWSGAGTDRDEMKDERRMSGSSIGPKAAQCMWLFALGFWTLAARIDGQTPPAARHETFVARTVNLSVGAGQDMKIDIFRWSSDDEAQ